MKIMNMIEFTGTLNAQQDIHKTTEAFADLDDKEGELMVLFDGFAKETTTVSKKDQGSQYMQEFFSCQRGSSTALWTCEQD
ncbi:hypothetical protein M5D96_012113 [Drosophila gunungcola]|uniref:Uncharacterized protein n=1 Tax=Drosophila gunungcola TaxID=103775 RepID=A0A9P9YDT5_9MUSC|nr:hypothetical protein M5D96_012113 [Drosophila gunungcola]